jgi:hypothetical protein
MLERYQIELTVSGRELQGDGDDWRQVWAAFCELAREPADEPFERGGHLLRVGDDSDNDLLLHESDGVLDASFSVYLTRQFGFEDEQREYAGMNALTLILECDRAPADRIPKAQRWGYAGRRRAGVSDEVHPEMPRWAGYVDSWTLAVEASNSFKVLETIPPSRWRIVQEDI